uniref:Uncharacterized protein n=1 Tax=Leersia perrieri TaxID=77586 RepID=A0A0D9VAJ1_9ORYZ
MGDRDVGILCNSKGNFTVAELTYRLGTTAELCFVRKQQQQQQQLQWRIKQLHMRRRSNHGNPRLDIGDWTTDSSAGLTTARDCSSSICSASSTLTIAMNSDSSRCLNRLGIRMVADTITPYRSICVTSGNSNNSRRSSSILKMVCITTASGKNNTGNFTITAWTLTNIHQNI